MESKWKETVISLGQIKEDSLNIFSFESKEPLQIRSIEPTCGTCTTVSMYKDNKFKVTYIADMIPEHVKELPYVISKEIKVTYMDNMVERLKFVARIIK